MFEFNFLCLLCNTNTHRNILMMLGTNVEQDEMTCCIQESQLWWDWGGGGGLVFFSKKTFSSLLKRLCPVPKLGHCDLCFDLSLTLHKMLTVCMQQTFLV